MTRMVTTRPVWVWACERCGREECLAASQQSLPTPGEMRARGWYIARMWDDMCPQCVSTVGRAGSQRDVWHEGPDGLLHAPETVAFPRQHVEKERGPLTPVSGGSE